MIQIRGRIERAVLACFNVRNSDASGITQRFDSGLTFRFLALDQP